MHLGREMCSCLVSLVFSVLAIVFHCFSVVSLGFTSLTQCSKEGCRFTRCRSALMKHGTLLEAAGTKQLEFGNYSFSYQCVLQF